MIAILLAAALLVALALCLRLEQAIRAERLEAAKLIARKDAETAAARAETAVERVAAAAERKELYQRIQAPEIAVHDAQLEARRERPYVRRKPIGADDDAAFAAREKEGDES